MDKDREKDVSTLDLLGILHYVLAGIIGLFSSFFILYIVMGVATLTMTFPGNGPQEMQPPAFMGWFFIVPGAITVLLDWGLAIVTFLSGRKLRQRKHRTFSVVVAAIECVFMPLGTVLGVFTLMTLMKPSVREAYESSAGRANSD